MDQLRPRFALMDPATGEKDWLPDLDIGQAQTWPLELGDGPAGAARALDGRRHEDARWSSTSSTASAAQWSAMTWPDLPAVDGPFGAVARTRRPALRPGAGDPGQAPEGGWPTGPDGEADDADAEGDTYRLWSASLTDASDVRDEGLTVGDLAFTDHCDGVDRLHQR